MRSLKDIKKVCGNVKRIRSAVVQSNSFAEAKKQKSYKPIIVKTPPTLKIGVQKSCKLKPKLLQENGDIKIKIELPQIIEKFIQLTLYEDILIIEGKVEGIEYYTECLLPFKVQSSINRSYGNGILHINLRRK